MVHSHPLHLTGIFDGPGGVCNRHPPVGSVLEGGGHLEAGFPCPPCHVEADLIGIIWLFVKNSKVKPGLKPAVPWWFNFDPYPYRTWPNSPWVLKKRCARLFGFSIAQVSAVLSSSRADVENPQSWLFALALISRLEACLGQERDIRAVRGPSAHARSSECLASSVGNVFLFLFFHLSVHGQLGSSRGNHTKTGTRKVIATEFPTCSHAWLRHDLFGRLEVRYPLKG